MISFARRRRRLSHQGARAERTSAAAESAAIAAKASRPSPAARRRGLRAGCRRGSRGPRSVHAPSPPPVRRGAGAARLRRSRQRAARPRPRASAAAVEPSGPPSARIVDPQATPATPRTATRRLALRREPASSGAGEDPGEEHEAAATPEAASVAPSRSRSGTAPATNRRALPAAAGQGWVTERGRGGRSRRGELRALRSAGRRPHRRRAFQVEAAADRDPAPTAIARRAVGAPQRGVDHGPAPSATQSIVFVASRSSAATASSRCSSFVSSSFVCERPRRLWTNSITVGTPARATSAASCSGPEGRRCERPGHLADRLVAEAEQRLVEQDRLDRPDLLPRDLDPLLAGEALARRLRLGEHRREPVRVEVALVEELLGGLDHGRDDPRPQTTPPRCTRRRRRCAVRSRGSRARASPRPRARPCVCPSASSPHAPPGRAT